MTETKKTISPFYDRVIMSLIKEETTRGGILLPDTAQDTKRARVVAIGPGKYDLERQTYLEPPMKVGDVVFVNPHLGNRLKLERNGEELLIQGTDEVLGREVDL